MREARERTQALLWALSDALAAAAALALAWLVRWDLNQALAARGAWHPFTVGETPPGPYLWAACAAIPICLLLFRELGLYRPGGGGGEASESFPRVAAAALAAGVALAALGFFVKEAFLFSRAYTLLFVPCCACTVWLGRAGIRALRRALWARGIGVSQVVLAGGGGLAAELARALEREGGVRVLGWVNLGPDEAAPGALERLGALADLPDILKRTGADEVIVAAPEAPREILRAILEECSRAHARFRMVPGVYEMLLEHTAWGLAGGIPLLGPLGSRIEGVHYAFKRFFDLLVAGVLLAALAPLLALLALLIRWREGGPVFFVQERIGFRGRSFRFWKFRTMRPGAERDAAAHAGYLQDFVAGHATPQVDAAGEAHFKLVADPRVTPLGRFLRRWSLDELPQLWNVLRGDMSLIGPRPPVPYEVAHYLPHHLRRFEVRPGISGLWQVSGRNRLSFEEMIKLDLYYIENWSLELDLRILVKTVGTVLFQRAH